MKSILMPFLATLGLGIVAAGGVATAQSTVMPAPTNNATPSVADPGQVPSGGGSPGTETATSPQSKAARSAAPQAGTVTTSTDYVREAAMSDLFEIRSSQLALKKSTNESVRGFASRMIADHQKSTATLKSTIASAKVNVALPTALDDVHKQILQKLQGLSGSVFDRTYMADQVQGHQDALQLQQTYKTSGDNSALQKFAGNGEKMVQMHLSAAMKVSESLVH